MTPNERTKDDDVRYGKSQNEANPGGTPPSGNAQYDPANQSKRRDMPDDEQKSEGQSMRGSEPSDEDDRSNQPHRPDHRSNQDRGSATEGGFRGG